VVSRDSWFETELVLPRARTIGAHRFIIAIVGDDVEQQRAMRPTSAALRQATLAADERDSFCDDRLYFALPNPVVA
jgi:hypothetical protein